MKNFINKKILLISLAILSLILATYFLFSYGFVKIHLRGGEAGEAALSLSGQDSTVKLRGEADTIRRLAKRGQQQILVSQNGRSGFAVVSAKGFLGTVSVDLELIAERDRVFIGNNPAACSYLIGGVMYSSECVDDSGGLMRHVPATVSQPTITQAVGSLPDGLIESYAKIKTGHLFLVNAAADVQALPHTIYVLDSAGGVRSTFGLAGLSPDKSYRLAAYQTGVLAYSDDGTEIYYYKSLGDAPKTISAARPDGSSFKFFDLQVRGEAIVMLYGQFLESDLSNFSDPEGYRAHSEVIEPDARTKEEPETEVIVSRSGETKRASFPVAPDRVRLCADQLLCVIRDNKMDVYSWADDKPRLSYSVSDVIDLDNAGNDTYVVRNDDVLLLNVESRQGYAVYTFGEYGYCGLRPLGSQSLLCIIGQDDKKAALLLDSDKVNDDSIDKKVMAALKLSQVEDISIYGAFIHVSPALGEPQLNPATGFFGYDQGQIDSTNQAVKSALADLGIDFKVYNFISAYR